MWAFVLSGALLADLQPLSPLFLAFLFAGIGAHIAGMWAHRKIAGRRGHVQPLPEDILDARLLRRARAVGTALFVLVVLGVLFFLNAYLEVVPSLDTLGLLQARGAYLEEVRGTRDKLFIYTTHLTLFGIAALHFSARLCATIRRRGLSVPIHRFNLLALSVFVAGVLTTGRTAPLLVIICYGYYALRFGLYSKTRIVVSFFGLSVSMFVLIAFALGKEGLGDGVSGDALDALANLGRVYFFSAPAALQEVVLRGEIVSTVCSNIFAYPIDLAKKFGAFAHCDAQELDFVFVPVATNVYTLLRAYWTDFGLAYIPALFVSGMLIDAVFTGANARAAFMSFLYPFVLNSLLLQVFEEQLFANGSVLLYAIAFYFTLSVVFFPSARRRFHPFSPIANTA